VNDCDDVRSKLQLLVDAELTGDDQEQIFAHLQTCQRCQHELDELETFSRQIRAARSQVQAPASLRERVEKSLAKDQAAKRSSQATGIQIVHRKVGIGAWWVGAAAMFFAVTASTVLIQNQRRQSTNLIRDAAILAQQDLERGNLPLDITTDSSQQVSAWFAGHLPFPFHMADSGIASDDRAKYKLVGGRLMNVKGERAALLSFRLPDEQVSVIVGPGSFPIDTGGVAVHSGNVTLHSREQNDMHIVSWKNRGLSYILVSRTPMRNPNTCARCHQGHDSGNNGSQQSTQLVLPSSSLHAELLAATSDISVGALPLRTPH
jgi:anti-sigma factor (TIGR02949 family)